MQHPIISIIIPCYNVRYYIERCLNSILTQTFEDIELILINDGSTDGTWEILKSYAKKDNRIRLINQDNQGVSSARNKGIQNALGTYIMFVDSDDWIDSKTCEKVNELLSREKYDLVIFGIVNHYKHKIVVDSAYLDKFTYSDSSEYLEAAWKVRKIRGYPFGKIFRRSSIIKNNLLFNHKLVLCEDLAFFLEALPYMHTIYVMPECLYHYDCAIATSATKRLKNASYILKTIAIIEKNTFINHDIISKLSFSILAKFIFFKLSLKSLFNGTWKKELLEIRNSDASGKYIRYFAASSGFSKEKILSYFLLRSIVGFGILILIIYPVYYVRNHF